MNLGRFTIHKEVLDIGNGDVVSELTRLGDNGFAFDTLYRYLKNINNSQVIACSAR